MKIGIIGADGSMGKIISVMAIEAPDIDICIALTEPTSPNIGKDIGILLGKGAINVEINSIDEMENLLDVKKPDVIIDFTVAPATRENAPKIIDHGIKMVIGTTGLPASFKENLGDKLLQKGIPSIMASNMAVGMNIFMETVKEMAKKLTGWDIEIIEAHHNRKLDAPSGTALTIAEKIATAIEKKLDSVAKYGRTKGKNPRKKGPAEIGIHAIRGGDIVGDHTVLFAGKGERIELTHRAHDRSCFASGALDAARFLMMQGLEPKLYSINDVLGLSN